ncbi:MAG: hypothetical protein IKT39_06915 [Clostridia bacterium]|nr:hypothetical protein [Clostridia bacterium]
MFGYVNVCRDELKVKELRLFNAYYCGLCKRQGKLCGPASRLILSYDFTVLALLLDSMEDDRPTVSAGRCMLHPFKKRPVVTKSSSMDYCAQMSVALTYYKALDDFRDEGVSIKNAALALKPEVNKIKKKYPDKLKNIEKYLCEITEAEKLAEKNIDIPAGAFGRLMAELFCMADTENRALYEFGYNIGRWIYVTDAIDDFEKDKIKGRYNPFSSAEEIDSQTEALWYNLSAAAAAYELLDVKRNKQILDNIVYIGLKNATEKVLKER